MPLTVVDAPKKALKPTVIAGAIYDGLLSLYKTQSRSFRALDDRTYFGHIYFWQVVFKIAEDRLKHAWTKTQNHYVVPPDGTLRESKVYEERIVAQGTLFACIAKLSRPRKIFDRDLFITKVAAKYKIKVRDLHTLAEQCEHDSQPSLSKKVLEL